MRLNHHIIISFFLLLLTISINANATPSKDTAITMVLAGKACAIVLKQQTEADFIIPLFNGFSETAFKQGELTDNEISEWMQHNNEKLDEIYEVKNKPSLCFDIISQYAETIGSGLKKAGY